MNLKITLFLILLIPLAWKPVKAQQFLSLKTCHDSCTVLFPLSKQMDKLDEISQLNKQVLSSKYLPTVDFLAKASYQSEVVVISVDVPGVSFPEMPKDQYSANVEIKQLIYDGGRTNQAQKVVDANTGIQKQQVDVELYSIKEQLNNLYFNALLLQESKKIIDLLKENLQNQYNELQQGVKEGVALASQLDQLQVELLKLEQQSIELQAARSQAIKAISILACFPIEENVELKTPSVSIEQNQAFFRPEHQLFMNQMNLLDSKIDLNNKNRMPIISAFANVGYGKPGYDFFNNNMHGYYLVGGQLKWNIWDWKKTRREKQQYTLQKQIVLDKQDGFNKNLDVQLNQAELTQQKLEQLITSDEKIILLQEKISKRAASRMKQGVISSAEYLNHINAEKQSRINLSTRKIQQVQNQINTQHLKGNINFN